MKTKQIAYELHPVSPERKKELMAQGFVIVDAVFAPIEAGNPAQDSSDEKPSMSKAELQAALDAKGIAHKPAMSKAELQAMLDAAQ